jgi:ParB-like chromosome segregation protein Spo0J
MALATETTGELVARPIELPIDQVRMGEAVRSGGLEESHVRLLIESGGRWPPIVVWDGGSTASGFVVVDGAHRLEAARRLGSSVIRAIPFFGTSEEMFVESVRRNIEHGLPLTLEDRRWAARRLLSWHREWSDRRVGSVCGISGRTVARLRSGHLDLSSPGESELKVDVRIGRDGRSRPVRGTEVRKQIRALLDEHPDASLRAIAEIAQTSHETVRRVRASQPERDPVPATSPCTPRPHDTEPLVDLRTPGVDAPLGSTPDGVRSEPRWTTSHALLTSGDGGRFARWFESTAVTDEWHDFVFGVPRGCIYEVVDEARRRAATWTAFAGILESRAR